ncbi:MAG: hypothetical protein LCH66_00825 [Actinobacteria bacterium]|jgi:hypothetical protein|nr:hypothetical protein [Actinomycetota bacterium]
MNTLELALKGASNVLYAGLTFGVGLPVIYALAMRLLTIGGTTETDANGAVHLRPTARGKALMALLMAVIIGGVALGITIIVASGMGKVVSFEHVIPVLVDKKK